MAKVSTRVVTFGSYVRSRLVPFSGNCHAALDALRYTVRVLLPSRPVRASVIDDPSVCAWSQERLYSLCGAAGAITLEPVAYLPAYACATRAQVHYAATGEVTPP